MILIPKSVSLSLVTHRLKRDGIGEKDCNEISNPDNDCNESDNNIGDVKFRFPTFEEFCRIKTGNSNNKYEFATSGNSAIRAFIEEPKRFPVDEISNADESDEGRTGQRISGFDGNGNRKADQTMEEFPGNEEFLDESLFSCSDNTKSSDSFLSDQDFQGKLDAECNDDPIPGSNSPSGLEESQGMLFPDEVKTDFLSEKDFESQLDSDNNTANKLETLWEHQELIEQLKMELRKVRATGLPTIVEESESPRITTDDIKPWKIDESLQHEDCIDEVNKLYKSYSETMRKFDILNYQKMYAMGFVQLKDPFKHTPQQRSPPSTLKSLIFQNLGLFRHKRNEREDNPVKKLVSDLRGDLEVVYVGQVCLSWEFLHWQYAKALDLWNSDPNGMHHYNEVAAEFQQFQVLIQRFLEDEPFQGPRVQSYVKMRCVLRNLLQVPAIREDEEEDKKNKARRRSNRDNEYIITSEILVETIEESIRILWQFIRSDKDCSAQPSNGHKNIPHLHNPQDLKFLSQIKGTLQKKERKLKDIMRSEKCILRRFQQTTKEKANDRVSDQALFFFAQVDMKLVSRVLNMSKITRDQLLWCQNKLSRISFLNRRIHVNPAAATFLQFPCNN